MAYVAPIRKPTSIRHALLMRIISPDEDDLVIAKANRLEIWRLTEDGMSCLHTKLIHGTIAMLQRLRPRDSETDLLFVGTDRQQYFNLAWNQQTGQLDVVGQTIEDNAEPYMRHTQSQNKCLVDPSGKFMAMHLWEGVLNVFRLPTRKGSTMKLEGLGQIRLTELWMKSSTFIHTRDNFPRIAFLYKTQLDKEEARIAVYRLTKDEKGSDVAQFDPHRDRLLDESIPDPYASMLIPVPLAEEKRYHVRNNEGTKAHLGGLLVVGETQLAYYDSLTYTSVFSILTDPKIYVAWAEYDGTHFFLADDYGRLDLLTIETSAEQTGVVVTGMSVHPFHFPDSSSITSRASSLVYMGHDFLFLASHRGDSQLLKIDIESKTMVQVKSLSNNGPILDFAIMDMGNREGDVQFGNTFSSGQARIVAGCGAHHDGSLRSIRSGIGLEDRGMLDEIPGTRGIFSLKSHESTFTNILALSFIGETRILKFDSEGGIEEIYQFEGMTLDTETLLAKNLSGQQLLQVTSQSVVVLDSESGVTVCRWDVPDGKSIIAASANAKWVLLSVDGTELVSLDLSNGLAARTQNVKEAGVMGQGDEISCLHAAPDLQDVGVVGWWASGSISVIDLTSLKPIQGETLRQTVDSASVPRDIALVQLHSPDTAGPTLLVALEDGHVVTFNVSKQNLTLSGRKSVILGSSPARLHILPQEGGVYSVFATTEHASLIYGSHGRIDYSATTADDATFVAPFDSEAFPGSIVLSTHEHVKLCSVDKERLTHVKSLAVRETVRRLAYSPSLKAFGLGCIKKELIHNEEVVTSTFKLVDEIIFKELGKPFVLDGSGSSSLEMVEHVMATEIRDSHGNLSERFFVGTSFVDVDDNGEPGQTRGRILVLEVDENRQIRQIMSHKLKGACRCLARMGDYIVAGLSKTTVVYEYTEETTNSGSLQRMAAYRTATFPVDLDVNGNTIGILDLTQSLSLVEFIPPTDGEKAKLVEKGRHQQPLWGTAVCNLDENRWLETDAQGNIVVLRRNEEVLTELDQSRLEVTSEMNIGEQINRIKKLHVAPPENAVVAPRAFLGSVSDQAGLEDSWLMLIIFFFQIEGALYLYGDITPKYQDLLMTFQGRLQEYVKVPGGISFDVWRAFRSATREGDAPFRFVDGEMVERFLDLDEGKQELVCEGLGPSVEDMRNIVEELRRMH
ncbi:mono-functional DNA-alkylating methyl methanesulfonate N-term-domain-containing protein [Stachybotrys elegans]|uniref:DNA damage-binding protein 1 n=1 Tax=Stachybotrys elegans TaxID=80388 RepID=A0A8K0SXQ4_9HYPO|nr:mono-functional DNA-alkylating methyl methanesulfonate N-term-domain-containing protein [Stachybotrys elegans]